MISESGYWKAYLHRLSLSVRRSMMQKRWSGPSFAKSEISIMTGFYAIRKLIEANKLTCELIESPISAFCYQATGKQVTYLNNHKLDQLYNLEARQQVSISLAYLCNQFIHSYIFMPLLSEENHLSEILVASDRQRMESVYSVEAERISNVFESVSKDEVLSMHTQFNAKKGDYLIKNYAHPHEPVSKD